jgi:hypothetical protein
VGGVTSSDFWIGAIIHAIFTLILVRFAYRTGFKSGAKHATKDMIDLLGAVKIDNWEQSVFRDRFRQALQWALDGKRKRDRNATPPSNG